MKPKLEANNANSTVSISIKITLWRSLCTLCFFTFNKYFLYAFIFMIQTNLEALSEMSQSEANTIDLTLSLLWITPGSTILYCNLILNKYFCWLPKSSGQRSPATVELFHLHLCLQYQFIYLVVFIFREQICNIHEAKIIFAGDSCCYNKIMWFLQQKRNSSGFSNTQADFVRLIVLRNRFWTTLT